VSQTTPLEPVIKCVEPPQMETLQKVSNDAIEEWPSNDFHKHRGPSNDLSE
jgi:hypothetical protein